MTPFIKASEGVRRRNGHEEERAAKQRVSLSADRRENQGAKRLAGRDAQPAPYLGQGSRSRSRRGVEVEKAFQSRRSGVVARRNDLHRRDLQERREDDLRQRGGSEGSFGPLQLQSRREHKACHRLPRGREDRRGGVEDSRSRRRDPEQVHSPKLIHGIKHFSWDPARSHRLGSIIESGNRIAIPQEVNRQREHNRRCSTAPAPIVGKIQTGGRMPPRCSTPGRSTYLSGKSV